MRQGFDHSPGGVAQQLRIGVQRDDKSNALELSPIARIEKSFQLGRGFADEESIELFQLATLALPADPALLALAPRAPAMKKKEAACSVPAIQFLDPAGDDVDVLRVLGHALPRCIGKIGQERKAQIRIGVSKVTNLEAVELALDCVGVVSNIGTTTSVRQSSGMPSFLNDIFGNTCGGRSEVTK